MNKRNERVDGNNKCDVMLHFRAKYEDHADCILDYDTNSKDEIYFYVNLLGQHDSVSLCMRYNYT